MPMKMLAAITVLLCTAGCVERATFHVDGDAPDTGSNGDATADRVGPDSGPDSGPDVGPEVSPTDTPEEVAPPDTLPDLDVCQPDCEGKQCGADGCGGSCGECMIPWECQEGTCVCQPDCAGKECGGDGCGDLCGECMGLNEVCKDGQCACADQWCVDVCCNPGEVCDGAGECCVPNCVDKQCGSDDCGGDCGECGDEETCFFVLCLPTQCDDGNEVFWDGCTGGQITEFQVTEVTVEAQQAPAVVALSDGGFSLCWESWNQEGLWNWGIIGHSFASDGTSASGEFIVNSTTVGAQQTCDVTTLIDGSMVFVWESANQDQDKDGIFAQVYSAEGEKLSPEDILVNSYQTNDQRSPTVCGLGGGGFVTLWQSWGNEGSSWGVYGQRFDGSGQKLGVEFHVNQYETNNQQSPDLACLPGGGFVAAWESGTQDGSFQGIYARIYDAEGTPAGDEFLVPAYADWDQTQPAVAALPDDGFVVIWTTPSPGEEAHGIFGRRFNAAGNPLWGDFQVNTYSPGNQTLPDVASVAAGGFVVVWVSDGQDGNAKGIFGQRFDGEGDPAGEEFAVNVYIAGDQSNPTVDMFDDGSFIVAWESLHQDGDNFGVFAQRFSPEGSKIEH